MKKITYILILMILFSCTEKGIKKPKDLIPKDKMVDLLFDMHLANKTRNIKNLDNKKNSNYFSIISEKHKVDSTRFKASHTYYMDHINEYRDIYRVVETRLDTLLKRQEKIVKIADSLKKIEDKKNPKKEKTKLKQKYKKPVLNKSKLKQIKKSPILKEKSIN